MLFSFKKEKSFWGPIRGILVELNDGPVFTLEVILSLVDDAKMQFPPTIYYQL